MSDLLQQIRDNSTSIDSVRANVPEIPDAIWHLMLTDCAERVLHTLLMQDKIVDQRLWDVVWIKRKWAVGQATSADLNKARKHAAVLESELAHAERSRHMYYGVTPKTPQFLAPREGLKIVEYTTRKNLKSLHIPRLDTFGIDWSWQIERLLGLCELSQWTDRLLLAYEEDSLLPIELAPIEPAWPTTLAQDH